jgi:ataxia telangiectasia mutated family protein
MLSLPTGKLVHIDFTDIMEKLQDRRGWPEQVPCRLTPAFLRPLDVLGADGEFKRHCVALLEALRDRADQIVELLSVFFEDPLSRTENLTKSRDSWKQNVEIIRKKLTGVDARLSEAGDANEDWAGMAPEYHVEQIIAVATDREKLKQMWPGWRPWW